MSHLSERQRDLRDLRILEMLDSGATQDAVAAATGVSRGLITRLLGQIKKDEVDQ